MAASIPDVPVLLVLPQEPTAVPPIIPPLVHRSVKPLIPITAETEPRFPHHTAALLISLIAPANAKPHTTTIVATAMPQIVLLAAPLIGETVQASARLVRLTTATTVTLPHALSAAPLTGAIVQASAKIAKPIIAAIAPP